MPVLRRRRSTTWWTRPKGRVDRRGMWWYYEGRWGVFEVLASPGNGVCLASVTFVGVVTMWPRITNRTFRSNRVKKKVRAAEQTAARHIAAVESNILKDLMGIVNHCAVTRYDDGDERKPGWISVKTFGSAWQVEAKDPDTCQSLRVVQANLDDALGLLNLLLESEEAPWEPDTWLQQQAAKNRKK